MTVLSQRDVQVIISLCGPDLNYTVRKLDSLKQLAQSVRIKPGTFASADIIRINVRKPDAAIREQLLQLTPLGSARDDVFVFLDRRLRNHPYSPDSSGLSRRGIDLEVDLVSTATA
ncbi:MAG TPA: hypothetical protein VK993_10880 [Chthoniobacterales bacterium]|nr:hypothetical protein [Chthoniobacterales bacterium]